MVLWLLADKLVSTCPVFIFNKDIYECFIC